MFYHPLQQKNAGKGLGIKNTKNKDLYRKRQTNTAHEHVDYSNIKYGVNLKAYDYS
jgi:hypothetical protein